MAWNTYESTIPLEMALNAYKGAIPLLLCLSLSFALLRVVSKALERAMPLLLCIALASFLLLMAFNCSKIASRLHFIDLGFAQSGV